MLKIQKQHHEWMPQEIALAFTTKFPMLGLNILQIKWHLKHINCRRKELTYNNKIYSNENGKKIKYYLSPWKIPIAPKKNKIKGTNTQYISKTLHYVTSFSERIPLNNDIEFNKIISSLNYNRNNFICSFNWILLI